jgi:hypothetical protein
MQIAWLLFFYSAAFYGIYNTNSPNPPSIKEKLSSSLLFVGQQAMPELASCKISFLQIV